MVRRAVFVFWAAWLAAGAAHSAEVRWALVTGPKCNLRSGPDSSSINVVTLQPFTPLQLTGERENDYCSAKTLSGTKGWAHKTVITEGNFASTKTDKTSVKTGPLAENDEAYSINIQNYPFQVLDARDDRVRVVDYEGDEGWVSRTSLSKDRYCIVNIPIANVRASAGEQYDTVFKARKGIVLEILRQDRGWLEVQFHEEGKKPIGGWISPKVVWGAPPIVQSTSAPASKPKAASAP